MFETNITLTINYTGIKRKIHFGDSEAIEAPEISNTLTSSTHLLFEAIYTSLHQGIFFQIFS